MSRGTSEESQNSETNAAKSTDQKMFVNQVSIGLYGVVVSCGLVVPSGLWWPLVVGRGTGSIRTEIWCSLLVSCGPRNLKSCFRTLWGSYDPGLDVIIVVKAENVRRWFSSWLLSCGISAFFSATRLLGLRESESLDTVRWNVALWCQRSCDGGLTQWCWNPSITCSGPLQLSWQLLLMGQFEVGRSSALHLFKWFYRKKKFFKVQKS